MNVNQVGVYVVTYSAIDSDDNLTVRTISVTVFTDTDPVIEADEHTIFLHTPFSPLDHVSAYDHEDGEFEAENIVVLGEVNVSQAGIYPITFQVTDSDGNTVERTINVTVVVNQPPIISNVSNITVWEVDFRALAERVSQITANDPEDGPVPVSILGEYSLFFPGVYTLTARAVDSMGAETLVNFNLTVREDRAPVLVGLRDFSIPLRQGFDLPRGLLEGVSVTDDKDDDTC